MCLEARVLQTSPASRIRLDLDPKASSARSHQGRPTGPAHAPQPAPPSRWTHAQPGHHGLSARPTQGASAARVSATRLTLLEELEAGWI